eukprot:XP_001709055.1 Hypothetical protein GL50803_26603 [Giardia lamblia ATCC 50803]
MQGEIVKKAPAPAPVHSRVKHERLLFLFLVELNERGAAINWVINKTVPRKLSVPQRCANLLGFTRLVTLEYLLHLDHFKIVCHESAEMRQGFVTSMAQNLRKMHAINEKTSTQLQLTVCGQMLKLEDILGELIVVLGCKLTKGTDSGPFSVEEVGVDLAFFGHRFLGRSVIPFDGYFLQ